MLIRFESAPEARLKQVVEALFRSRKWYRLSRRLRRSDMCRPSSRHGLLSCFLA